VRILIGGIGYRFQGDLSFGLHVTDALDAARLPDGVDVLDLGYGAIYVAQDLGDAEPRYDRVVLVAAAVRDRAPGLYGPSAGTGPPRGMSGPAEVQARILEAGAGVIDLDHLLVIGTHFGAFPADLRVVEFEPTDQRQGERLSALAERLLPAAIARVRRAALEPAVSETGTAERGACGMIGS
jgi:hypothetical protein